MEELALTISTSLTLKASLSLMAGIIRHLQTPEITDLLTHALLPRLPPPQPVSFGFSLTPAWWFALQASLLSKNHCQATVSCVLSDYPGKKVLSAGRICHSGP